MFTYTEIGLKMGYDRAIAAMADEAQAIIDRKAASLDVAHAEIRRLQRELALERAVRIAAELKLEKLLDMPA